MSLGMVSPVPGDGIEATLLSLPGVNIRLMVVIGFT